MTEHTTAGRRFRRKVARELRQRFRHIRRWRNAHRRSWGHFLIGEVALKAKVTPDDLRGFLYGGKDLDTFRVAAVARALGLKPGKMFVLDVSGILTVDPARLAS